MKLKIMCFALIGMLSIQCQTKKKAQDTSKSSTPDTTLQSADEQTTAIQDAANEYTHSPTCTENPQLESCQAASGIGDPDNKSIIKDVVEHISQDDMNAVQEAGAPTDDSTNTPTDDSSIQFQRWGALTVLIVATVATIGIASAYGYKAWKTAKANKEIKKNVSIPEIAYKKPDIANGIREWAVKERITFPAGHLESEIKVVLEEVEKLSNVSDPNAIKKINENLGEKLYYYHSDGKVGSFYKVLYGYSLVTGDKSSIKKLGPVLSDNIFPNRRKYNISLTWVHNHTRNDGFTPLEDVKNSYLNSNDSQYETDYKKYRQTIAEVQPFENPKLKKISMKTKALTIASAILSSLSAVGGSVAFGTSFTLAENSDTDASRFLNRLNQIMDAILASR